MSKPKKQTKPLAVEMCRLFTPDDLLFERSVWVEGLSTDIDEVKKEYPNAPIYEYRLVAVHTPPVVPTEYTRKEFQ